MLLLLRNEVIPPQRVRIARTLRRPHDFRRTRAYTTRVRFVTVPTGDLGTLQADGVSSATLALTAPTQIPLDPSAGVSSATLALTAPALLALAQSSGVSIATLVLTALATPLGDASHGEAEELIVVRTRGREFSIVGGASSDTFPG